MSPTLWYNIDNEMTSKTLKPYKEERPWGNFVEFTKNEASTVKIVTIHPQSALSLQSHMSRDEFWHVISGQGTFTVGEKKLSGAAGSEFFVPRGTKHRIETDSDSVVILEIAFGEFDESDITRFEDRYGRDKK